MGCAGLSSSSCVRRHQSGIVRVELLRGEPDLQLLGASVSCRKDSWPWPPVPDALQMNQLQDAAPSDVLRHPVWPFDVGSGAFRHGVPLNLQKSDSIFK